MLKRDITYEDFNGNAVTETFYFNLNRSEIVKLEVGHTGGSLEEAIQRIIRTQDKKGLVDEFEAILLAAYGVKSEDGKRFIKSDELRLEFTQTAAYDALFMDLMTSEESMANFIKGVIPKDVAAEVTKREQKQNIFDGKTLPAPPEDAPPGVL